MNSKLSLQNNQRHSTIVDIVCTLTHLKSYPLLGFHCLTTACLLAYFSLLTVDSKALKCTICACRYRVCTKPVCQLLHYSLYLQAKHNDMYVHLCACLTYNSAHADTGRFNYALCTLSWVATIILYKSR